MARVRRAKMPLSPPADGRLPELRRIAGSLLLFLCLLPAPASRGQEGLKVPGVLRPFRENRILYTAPGEGFLSLWLERGPFSWPLLRDVPLRAGENAFDYDALGPGGEALGKGSYVLQGVYRSAGQDGVTEVQAVYSLPLRMGAPLSALLYALPAAAEAYEGEAFEVDLCLSAPGWLNVRLQDEGGAQLRAWMLRAEGSRPRAFRWNGEAGGRPVPPGGYALIFSAGETPAREIRVAFSVREGHRPALPVLKTETFLPEKPEDIPAALAAPLVVADVGATAHQKVYTAPSLKAAAAGTVHGQTAGLRVLALEGDFARVGAWRHEDGAYVEGYVPLAKLKTVLPHPGYGILIDKAAQTMTLYRDGEALSVQPVSTGLMEKNRLFRETRAGAYLLERRIAAFSSEGFLYEYAIRIDGGNLIHQAGCRIRGGMPDFSAQLPLLGQKASHGCVRVDPYGPYNMYWLWTHLPRGTKVLVLDDPEQRQARLLEIQGEGGAPLPAEPSPSPPPAEGTIPGKPPDDSP